MTFPLPSLDRLTLPTGEDATVMTTVAFVGGGWVPPRKRGEKGGWAPKTRRTVRVFGGRVEEFHMVSPMAGEWTPSPIGEREAAAIRRRWRKLGGGGR